MNSHDVLNDGLNNKIEIDPLKEGNEDKSNDSYMTDYSIHGNLNIDDKLKCSEVSNLIKSITNDKTNSNVKFLLEKPNLKSASSGVHIKLKSITSEKMKLVNPMPLQEYNKASASTSSPGHCNVEETDINHDEESSKYILNQSIDSFVSSKACSTSLDSDSLETFYSNSTSKRDENKGISCTNLIQEDDSFILNSNIQVEAKLDVDSHPPTKKIKLEIENRETIINMDSNGNGTSQNETNSKSYNLHIPNCEILKNSNNDINIDTCPSIYEKMPAQVESKFIDDDDSSISNELPSNYDFDDFTNDISNENSFTYFHPITPSKTEQSSFTNSDMIQPKSDAVNFTNSEDNSRDNAAFMKSNKFINLLNEQHCNDSTDASSDNPLLIQQSSTGLCDDSNVSSNEVADGSVNYDKQGTYILDYSTNSLEEFNWDDYLEDTKHEAAPPPAFLHVEKSLESGIESGQVIEALHSTNKDNKSTYWPAQIVAVCGNLIRLKYMFGKHQEFWKDIEEREMFELGHCKENNIMLDLPSNFILTSCNLDDVQDMLVKYSSPPKLALEISNYSITDRIKPGMKVELLSQDNHCKGSIYEVVHNKKGLLNLQQCRCSDGEEVYCSVFFTERKLKYLGWLKEHFGFSSYDCCSNECSSEHLEMHINKHLDVNEDLKYPAALITDQNESLPESFSVNMYFETYHPITRSSFHIAKIIHISDNYFQYEIYGSNELKGKLFTTTINDPCILRCGVAHQCNSELSVSNAELIPTIQQPFSWEKFITEKKKHEENVHLLSTTFYRHPWSEDLGFAVGQILEVLNPQNEQEICTAVIIKLYENLMFIKLDSDISQELLIYPSTSTKLFPVGWALCNGYNFVQPSNFKPHLKMPTERLHLESDNLSSTENNIVNTDNLQHSYWCPRLYINHWCQCGPFLSKSKIAKKSQCLGPGPIELVLREVLASTISAAYIPTKALKEIAQLEQDNPTWHPIMMKAKYKRYELKCNISIPTVASHIKTFLNLLSSTLQYCPNLWSFSQTGEICPLMCHPQITIGSGNCNLNQKQQSGKVSNLTSFWQHRRKRGGRKRLFVPIKPTNTDRLYNGNDINDGDDDLDRTEELYDDTNAEEGEVGGSCSDEGDESLRLSRPTSPVQSSPRTRKRRGSIMDSSSANKLQEKSSNGRVSGQGFLEPAAVTSDPLEWSINDVEQYITSEPAISHYAVKFKEQEVDGRALLLLNLPTLVHHLGLPHASAIILAQYICKVKLAHYLNYYSQEKI